MDKKVCKRCGRELPLSEFHKDKSRKDGYRDWCKECLKQHYKNNREKILEQQKQHYQENREKILEQQKQYNQEHNDEIKQYCQKYYQEHKDEILEQQKQYYQDNKDEILERQKQYYQEHKEEHTEWYKQYYQTQIGRAYYLVGGYRKQDKEANRGECTLTAQWIIDNIFTSKCHWCGETDWHKLGCDRIDNDKPHTQDNVNPCCEECNKKRGTMTYEEFLEINKK